MPTPNPQPHHSGHDPSTTPDPGAGPVRHFTAEQWLPYPVELVFAFFANPENLPRLMPRWQRARIEEATFAPPPPRPEGTPRYPGVAAGAGTRLLISARPLPLSFARVGWEALIEDFRWNEGFCDIQLQGPFRYWRHCHSVTPAPHSETGRPGTTLRDEVHYQLRIANGTHLAHSLVQAGMARMFRYRQQRTVDLLQRFTGR